MIPCLLLGHVVHVSGAIVDLADLVVGPGVVEDALRQECPLHRYGLPVRCFGLLLLLYLATGFLRLMGRLTS